MDNGFNEWGGYMEAKITKLEEQFLKSSDPFRQTNLFSGISIYVNGLTHPSADELKRLMMVHGGIYHTYERSHTTYIIASNLPDVKVRNMDTSKIISPKWIVDCIEANRILDYTKYLLYTNQKQSQPKISFEIQKKKESKFDEDNGISKNSEELNAHMKAPEPIIFHEPSKPTSNTARTAVDPNFLSEFYNNSRLHHISTLGAGFKQYVTDLREKHTGEFPGRLILHDNISKAENFTKITQAVMHIDMDCFFVSVGLRNHPYLRGQPVAVTHSKGGSAEISLRPGSDRKAELDLFAKRLESQLHNNVLSDKVRNGFQGNLSLSEIASCSYEAREKGVRNGMFVGQALQLCPNLKTIPYDFEGYKEVAFNLYDTIAQYTLDIEAVSCDEMFVNLTDLINDLQVDVMDFVTYVREEVKRKTSCPCSAGVGSNKLQARMATKRAKPDGQFHLQSENVEDFMCAIPIQDLPGVGSSTMCTLEEMNLLKCGDLQKVSLSKLQSAVGKKFGETLHQFCRGIDTRPLVYGQIRKSVSAEVNYGIRFKEFAELETFMRQLCYEVHNRLTNINRKGKCITLKLMIRAKEAPVEASKFMGHGICDHITKAVSLSDYTNDLETITRTVLTTMKAVNIPPAELRGIGIQITKLDEPREFKEKKENVIKSLFDKMASKQSKKPQDNEVPSCSKILTEQGHSRDTNRETSLQPVVKKIFSSLPIDKSRAPSLIQAPKNITKSAKTKSSDIGSSKIPKQASPSKGSKTKGKVQLLKKTSKGLDVLDMLQNAPTKRPVLQCDFAEDIDPSVLAELPDDIRDEILRTHPRAKVKKIESPETEFLNAMPPELKQEVQKQIDVISPEKKITHETVPMSPDNIFHQNDSNALLLSWVKSSSTPEEYDVELIIKHAVELVRAEMIGQLYDPLIYLCRIINRFGTCAWHGAYHQLINSVQSQMLLTYGKELFIRDQIECKQCSS